MGLLRLPSAELNMDLPLSWHRVQVHPIWDAARPGCAVVDGRPREVLVTPLLRGGLVAHVGRLGGRVGVT